MHYVDGSRIRDSLTGKEVMWRGAGCSYLMHGATSTDTLQGWQTMIPLLIQAKINTMRLAFKFAWDLNATADIFDFASMDAVINLLAQNGIKSILDHHGDYASQMLNPNLIPSWTELAAHYVENANVAAYELYNEPGISAGTVTKLQNAQGYHDLTLAVRTIDPDHICIWESPNYYIPPYDQILNLMLPNVVYTEHRWWTNNVEEINQYGANELSKMEFDSILYDRTTYNIPIWLGEFGGPGGGNPATPYDYSDPYWAICAELLWRSEEQVIGWNLWLGATTVTNTHLPQYMPLLPPKNFNTYLIRHPWQGAKVPVISQYVKTMNGVDNVYDYQLQMFHNNDSVTFNPGITVKVVRSHDVGPPGVNGNCPAGTWKGATDCWRDFEEIMPINEETTITNHEGTTAYPGDWNMYIYSIGRPTELSIPLWTWPLLTWLRNLLAGWT